MMQTCPVKYRVNLVPRLLEPGYEANIGCAQEQIYHLLSTHKLNTASGPDRISSHMLHGTAEFITPSITTLFNLP